jgi:hypothetical protein
MFAPVRDAGLRIAVAVFAADEASMVRLNDGLSLKNVTSASISRLNSPLQRAQESREACQINH